MRGVAPIRRIHGGTSRARCRAVVTLVAVATVAVITRNTMATSAVSRLLAVSDRRWITCPTVGHAKLVCCSCRGLGRRFGRVLGNGNGEVRRGAKRSARAKLEVGWDS